MANQEQPSNEINPLMPERFQEKTQLQDLNHRLSNYMQLMRMKREFENNKETIESDERKWSNQLESQRLFYEQQIADLREQLQLSLKEKNEVEAAQMKFQSMSSEYEERFLSLNDAIMKQTEEITKLQMDLSSKELELQQAKNQLTAPRTELDMCKLERDDLKKRLAEVERRCQSETKAKTELQQQLTEFHARCSHEIMTYQKEMEGLQERLERSQQVILELEESSRRTGQRDSDISEMMRKMREASEVELKRFMEEAEAKHNLDISEIKMRMQADRAALAALTEENGKLQAELNNTRTALQMAESQLTSVESAYKVAQTSLNSERKSFEVQMRKMERKLQETQDLLLIKMQELSAALDANVPLKAEIDMLRNLIEEEEKRTGLDTSFEKAVTSIDIDGSNKTTTKIMSQFQQSSQIEKNSSDGVATTNKIIAGDNQNSSLLGIEARLDGSLFTKPPNSLPLTTKAFARGAAGTKATDIFTPPNPSAKVPSPTIPKEEQNLADEDNDVDDDDDEIDATVGELIARKRDSNSRKGSSGSGIAFLPPRPDNPTPPRKLPSRPASASSKARYIPADAGQGRDYFDAMFNDLRKDTMYTRVTENNVGTDITRVVPSTKHDLINSTSSATGSLKIIDVDEGGKFVRVHNTSSTMVEDIGGHLLQQNVAGHPVAVFRFPPRTKLQPGHTATVWGAGSNEGVHDPPSHYVWKQLDKWGTGPECTTILCKANGQAIAWMTSAPRVSRISRAYQYQSDEKSQAAEIARLMKELHAQQTAYSQQQANNEQTNWDGSQAASAKLQMPFPSAYSEKPTMYSDSTPVPDPSPVLRREKMLPTSSRLLPSRTGSAPLRKYVVPPFPQHHASQPLAYHQRLATNGDAELIDLTTQRSARSKYGFDFMTHTPKVTSYDGTVRER